MSGPIPDEAIRIEANPAQARKLVHRVRAGRGMVTGRGGRFTRMKQYRRDLDIIAYAQTLPAE